MNDAICRAVIGTFSFLAFSCWMLTQNSSDIVRQALLIAGLGVVAASAWRVLSSRRPPPNIESGAKHNAIKRLNEEA